MIRRLALCAVAVLFACAAPEREAPVATLSTPSASAWASAAAARSAWNVSSNAWIDAEWSGSPAPIPLRSSTMRSTRGPTSSALRSA